MKTIAYVDGFNLYYRLLRDHRDARWLDLNAFITSFLSPEAKLHKINYYTARVKGSVDADAPRKQQLYLSALSSLGNLEVHFGKFMAHKTLMRMEQPPKFSPPLALVPPYPEYVSVLKIEEKGSDVNLGSQLVRDAFQDKFDQAVVLTNDTDLCEPIRIVVEEVGKPVGLLAPVDNPARSLKACSSWVKHLKPTDAQANQFPDKLTAANGKPVSKPSEWK